MKHHAALAKAHALSEKVRKSASAARARQAARAVWEGQKHSMVVGGTGFGLGYAESKAMTLPTIDGVEPVALYAAISFLAATVIKDKTIKRFAEGITDGLLGITLFKAGKNGFNSLFNYIKPSATAGWEAETGVVEEADINF